MGYNVALSHRSKQNSLLIASTAAMFPFIPTALYSTVTPTTPSLLAVIVLTLCDLERVQSPEPGVNFQLQRVREKSRGSK